MIEVYVISLRYCSVHIDGRVAFGSLFSQFE